ncbi:hypothetical protein ABK040_000410 [Willaertia magna]
MSQDGNDKPPLFLMDDVEGSINFAKEEEKVSEYWRKIDAFRTSLKKSEGKKEFSFYDGPPFATGLPHYGHILAGTIKDTVTRFAHQTGHHVTRRAGWDTHGLPIEFEIEKELGIKSKDEIMKLGIKKYNEHCRSIVMRYSSEWEKIIFRLGRWIDFENDYKTMDISFMESVWWVFKQLHDKGLVYRGVKVMPYSTGCTTPLSNFEVSQNYKDVYDPSIFITLPLDEDPEIELVAWTTTPWTLPSNLGLCVHPEFDYVLFLDKKKNKKYIVAEVRLNAKDSLWKNKEEIEIIKKMKGEELKGKTYKPLFDYFKDMKEQGAFKVVCDTYVTSESGTGIVHQAPGFGEDDYRVCVTNGIIKTGKDSFVPCPIDANGNFTSEVPDYQGLYIKDADKKIMEDLKERGRLLKKESIVHSYPFCWRSDTPLIYRTVTSWFVEVTKIKEQLLKNNDQSYWVPSFVKDGRFANWLKDARDWCVSRSRYWGTPIPIFISDDGEEMVVVGSIAELEELSGEKIHDLHRENIDHIQIPSKQGKGMLKRIEDVFDCWFESGSMPYAQNHYPFEKKELFEQTFPADFIAEGLDQTRGWFYTLLVLGTALFDKCPFKNVIVNGLVLAEDGSKMSKSKKNYPDPKLVIDKHGADALRLYLINSPVVRAEPLKFKEEGVFDVVKEILLQWYNAYRFFVQSVKRYVNETGEPFNSEVANNAKLENIMDKWIISSSNSLLKSIKEEMGLYRLYNVTPRLEQFIDHLTHWYVKMNNKRLKGEQKGQTKEDRLGALSALFIALYNCVRVMAPFTPFITEMMYQNLKKLLTNSEDSVHYEMIPDHDESKIDLEIERTIEAMQSVVKIGRTMRIKKNIPSRTPISEFVVCNVDEDFVRRVQSMDYFIKKELNIHRKLIATTDIHSYSVKLEAVPNMKLLGSRFAKKFREVKKAIDALSHEQLLQFMKEGEVTLCGEKITSEELVIVSKFVGKEPHYHSGECCNGTLILNTTLDDELKELGFCRETTSKVQQLRKEAGLQFEDKVIVYLSGKNSSDMTNVLINHKSTVTQHLKGMEVFFEKPNVDEKQVIITSEMNVDRLTQDTKYVVDFTLVWAEKKN